MASGLMAMDEAMDRVLSLPRSSLIAIDGLPCSGKTTMVARLEARMALSCLYLDEFVRPETEWPSRDRPAFPFEYFRYDAFLDAVRTLAATGTCTFYPFDWETLSVSSQPRTISLTQTVIVEGVSALNVELCPLYDFRIFIESDRETTLEAAIARGVGGWEREWRELFLPSAELYMASDPAARADILVAGRRRD